MYICAKDRKEPALNFSIARNGLVVKFMDDKHTIYDLTNGENVVASSSICCGLYRLDAYESVNEAMCTLFDMQVMLDAKIWHACFRHLNFKSFYV